MSHHTSLDRKYISAVDLILKLRRKICFEQESRARSELDFRRTTIHIVRVPKAGDDTASNQVTSCAVTNELMLSNTCHERDYFARCVSSKES